MSTLPKKIQSKIENSGYTFSKEGHCHYLDGKRLSGVTTILSVISKGDVLINWACKMAVDYIRENCEKINDQDYLVRESDLEEAKVAHRKKKEEAGSKGTDVHEEIEIWCKDCIQFGNGYAPEINKGGTEQFNKFQDWARDNKIKFYESELHLYSREKFIGGICDFVCRIDDEIYLGDIKTSSGIYPEAFLQMSAYQIMIEEMNLYENIKGHIVINLKKDGTMETKKNCQVDGNKEAFLAALTLYRNINDIK